MGPPDQRSCFDWPEKLARAELSASVMTSGHVLASPLVDVDVCVGQPRGQGRTGVRALVSKMKFAGGRSSGPPPENFVPEKKCPFSDCPKVGLMT